MSSTIRRTLGDPLGGIGLDALARLFHPARDRGRDGEQEQDAQGRRGTDPDDAPERAGVPRDRRHEPRGDAKGQDQGGEPINPGKADQEDRQDRRRAQDPRQEPAATPRPRDAGETPEASHREKNAEIRERDQPHEMATRPEEPIRVEGGFPENDRAHLEQARDKPAPCRQDQQGREGRPFLDEFRGPPAAPSGPSGDRGSTGHELLS